MQAKYCPNCGPNSSLTLMAHGLLAPWISEITNGKLFERTQLIKCIACSLIFYSYRFDSYELANIYSNYRESEYFSKRNKWEPWYTEKENSLYKPIDSNLNVVSRKLNIKSYLNRSGIILNKGISVLDFGGDQGQFFPEEAQERYLYDYSVKDNRSDVDKPIQLNEKDGDNNAKEYMKINRITDLSEIKNQDLVMLCGVLEHLCEPTDTLNSISKIVKVKEGILYIEVPLDSPKVWIFHRTIFYYRYLTLISNISKKYPLVFVFLDLITGIFRNLKLPIPWFGIVKQSEHINYFTSNSLKSMLEKNFKIIKIYENPKKKHGKFVLGELVAVLRM